MEAQASGLPVIVSAIGGPCELMEDGRTGIVVSGHDPTDLAQAMIRLLDPKVRRSMGVAARLFAERNRVDEPFTAILDAAGYRASLRHGDHPSRAVVRMPAHLDPDGELGDAVGHP